MTKALTESVKMIEKGYRRKLKKARWEATTPSFRNLDLDHEYKQGFDTIKIIVTDVLNIKQGSFYSKINSIGEKGSIVLVTSVVCPFCGKPAQLNEHWNCFFCKCNEHEKKIFEITRVVIRQ